MKSAIVIGGSGFIGSHVADKLSEKGFNVTIFDCFETKWKLKEQKFILGNILDKKALENAIKGNQIVYNFAAIADLNKLTKNPIDSINVNILGNVNVLEACRKFNVERFVFASSIYVYSREGGFYRCSKQASEIYIEEYSKTFNLNYTILRFGSLYGPRSDETNNIYRIISKALKSNKIIYKGDSEAMREYIHVFDAASASVYALSDDFLNNSFIITGQEIIKVMDMLKILAEIMGKKETDIVVEKQFDQGHYIRTPYSYQSKTGQKYIPPTHIDLGQGLLNLIEELDNQN